MSKSKLFQRFQSIIQFIGILFLCLWISPSVFFDGRIVYLQKGSFSYGGESNITPGNHITIMQVVLSFAQAAHAEEETVYPDHLLLEYLESDDVLIRYEAQQLLAGRQPTVIASIIERLGKQDETSDKWQYLATGLNYVIEDMLKKGTKPEEIGSQLKNTEDLKPLIVMLDHSDPSLRYTALSNLMHLRDPRVYPYLKGILEGEHEHQKQYNAALVLAEIFPLLDNPERKEVLVAINENKYNFVPLRRFKESVSITNDGEFKPTNKLTGWVHLGITLNDDWAELYFDWQNKDSNLPEKGDILVARGTVHFRTDAIRYDLEKEQWIRSGLLGMIRPGDKVILISIENISQGFYWAEVERVD